MTMKVGRIPVDVVAEAINSFLVMLLLLTHAHDFHRASDDTNGTCWLQDKFCRVDNRQTAPVIAAYALKDTDRQRRKLN